FHATYTPPPDTSPLSLHDALPIYAYAAAGNFKVGLAPFAFSDKEPIETILTASPSWWSIYNGSEHIEEAKAFLAWCASDEAQKIDRKSTRLNSSHVSISYAVFCLK